jgi:hypothetical protein
MPATGMCVTFITTPDGAAEFAGIPQRALQLVPAEAGIAEVSV